MLLNSARNSQSAHVAVQATALEKRKKGSLIRRNNQEAESEQRSNHAQSQHQRMEGANLNTVLPPPPEANPNAEGDWEVSRKRNKRKQRKEEKKSTVWKRTKADAILVRSKDQNAAYTSILKLIQDRVDNANKMRQT